VTEGEKVLPDEDRATEEDPGLTAVDAPDDGPGEAPEPEKPLVLDPKLDALIRQIAKEEIGKALGHTVV